MKEKDKNERGESLYRMTRVSESGMLTASEDNILFIFVLIFSLSNSRELFLLFLACQYFDFSNKVSL